MKKTYDHAEMLKMYDAGSEVKEIAKQIGCRPDTVQKVLKDHGRIEGQCYGAYMNPIYPKEIDRYRKKLRIGQKKILECQRYDEKFTLKTQRIPCIVEAKYQHIFVARDQRGRIRTARYIDMIVRERSVQGENGGLQNK